MAVPTRSLDPSGLVTIDTWTEARTFWQRNNGHGNISDIVALGNTVFNDVQTSAGFLDLVGRIRDQRISPELLAVDSNTYSGSLQPIAGTQRAYVGFADLVVGKTTIVYYDSTTWTAGSWTQAYFGGWSIEVAGTTSLHAIIMILMISLTTIKLAGSITLSMNGGRSE